jgi:hypothetical protein
MYVNDLNDLEPGEILRLMKEASIIEPLEMQTPSAGMLRRVALVRTDIVFLRSVLRLLVTANVVPCS